MLEKCSELGAWVPRDSRAREEGRVLALAWGQAGLGTYHTWLPWLRLLPERLLLPGLQLWGGREPLRNPTGSGGRRLCLPHTYPKELEPLSAPHPQLPEHSEAQSILPCTSLLQSPFPQFPTWNSGSRERGAPGTPPTPAPIP